MPSLRHFVVTTLALVMLRRAACDPALRGTLDPQQDRQRASGGVENTGNMMDAGATSTERGMQQTNIQSFIETNFNDTTLTGVTGSGTHQLQNQAQIATSPNVGGGPGVVFGGGTQPGAIGGPAELEAAGAGVGFRRGLEETDVAEDIQVEDIMSVDDGATERALQQTILQAFIYSYETTNERFNDTGPTGITGPTTHLPQVAHAPVESGGAGGVVYGGGAGAGTPGIAGGTMPLLAGQSGVGAGGTGVGASSTGLGTTAGTIGGAPASGGFVGPSGLPAPVAAPGGVGSSGGLGSAGGGGGI